MTSMQTARAILMGAALAAAGCSTWSNPRYVGRIGLLCGQKDVLDRYAESIAAGRTDDLFALFDREAEAQRSAADAILDLRSKLAPLLATGAAIEMVEAEVRDFRLDESPPSANLWFTVGGRDKDGARHLYRIQSFTTFRELSRQEPDLEGLEVAELAILAQDPFEVHEVSAVKSQFEDATERAGLADRHRNQSIDKKCLILQGTMPGSGAAAADFDGDGRVDLAAIDGQHSILYRNRGDGTFEDQSQQWGMDRVTGAGCVAADYDNDGDQDLYVLDHFGATKLLRNDAAAGSGGRTFTDVTAESGAGCVDPTFSASFADVDRDGDLDLYVPVAGDYYSEVPMPPFQARDGRPDRLFINDGAGRFTEEGEARGVADVGWGLASGFCDYDLDGDDDLYLANDFGLNFLFRNDGTGHFEDVSADTGTSDRGYGMGVSWGDVDADGDFDLYVSNIYSEYAPVFLDPDYPLPFIGQLFRGWVSQALYTMGLGNSLLINPKAQGEEVFTDVAKKWRVNECGWAWAGMFIDMENDGDLDIYCPNGSYTGTEPGDLELTFWSLSSLMWERSKMQQWLFDAQGRSLQGHERDRLFEQKAPGTFEEVGYLHGVNGIETGRGLAIADFDDDGDLDLYQRNLNDEARYFRNVGGGNHWLKLALVGTRSNRDALGAIVRAKVGDRTLMQQVVAGDGFYSSSDKRLVFGLGEQTAAEVEITWPSGLVEKLGSLAADRAYRVVEGSGNASDLARAP